MDFDCNLPNGSVLCSSKSCALCYLYTYVKHFSVFNKEVVIDGNVETVIAATLDTTIWKN